jgi:FxsC-like protein
MRPFFLSYARLDRTPRIDPDDRILEFYRDLNAAVQMRLGALGFDDGFMDQQEIGAGERWDQTLVNELQASRVLIPVYSGHYFGRPVCGQEWEVFRMRQAVHREIFKQPEPPVILPVLWTAEDWLPPVPWVARGLNYTYKNFPDAYRQGLYQIMDKPRLRRAHYQDVVDAFAEEVARAARAYDLPLATVPDLAGVQNAFALAGPGGPQPGGRGSRHVKVVYVAATPAELEVHRQNRDAYGEGGMYWHPFQPEDEVSLIAQQVASAGRYFYEPLQFGPGLQQAIQSARSMENIVVMVVDPWTLRVMQYYNEVRACDEREDLDYLVIVPWMADEETVRARNPLEQVLGNAFRKRPQLTPRMYLSPISTASEFRDKLAVSLELFRGGNPAAASEAAAGAPTGGGRRGLPTVSATGGGGG